MPVRLAAQAAELLHPGRVTVSCVPPQARYHHLQDQVPRRRREAGDGDTDAATKREAPRCANGSAASTKATSSQPRSRSPSTPSSGSATARPSAVGNQTRCCVSVGRAAAGLGVRGDATRPGQPRHVAAFVREHPNGPSTVRRDLALLHAIFKTARRQELVEPNPAEGAERPKLPPFRPQILEPVEVARVAKAFTDEQARDGVPLLVLTGVRRSELQRLRCATLTSSRTCSASGTRRPRTASGRSRSLRTGRGVVAAAAPLRLPGRRRARVLPSGAGHGVPSGVVQRRPSQPPSQPPGSRRSSGPSTTLTLQLDEWGGSRRGLGRARWRRPDTRRCRRRSVTCT